ncbi:hypothetical protein H5410_064836 [Solanum commersonii]|uniref:Uncharacterized protein n=1 Tax=Solanum commersonii TaxID=4109 RepID=A0A9J5VYA2_SOLCO|nr:hypothetical protein H5410_064836 [Solanum commersonii]
MDVHKLFDERLTSNFPTYTPIERDGEESISIESIVVEVFNGHSQGELLERYINATHINRDSNEPQIHKIKTLEGKIPVDAVMPDMDLCKGRSTIVVDEFKEIFKISTCQIANTFIDQRLLTQFQFNLGVTTFIVPIHGISSDFGVWDPGISSTFLVLTRSNNNVEAHALFE